tara:strand:+ start:901 stop:1788 length:888 start_codon:yes stop_codon:yes gene_type:complete
MSNATWYELADLFCAREKSLLYSEGDNPFFERCAARRYNYATKIVAGGVRLVFLKSAAVKKTNKTLYRNGRFIWCKNLKYEGKDNDGYRTFSFTLSKGNKRFHVSECDVLALPHSLYINNNSFFRKYNKVFSAFASVFKYRDCVKIMRRNDDSFVGDTEDYLRYLEEQSPYKPGTLVKPRKGLFFPKLEALSGKMENLVDKYCEERNISYHKKNLSQFLSGRRISKQLEEETLPVFRSFFEWSKSIPEAVHPVGVVVGGSRDISPHSGRELYRVSFAETIYEKMHPIQMEIIHEV